MSSADQESQEVSKPQDGDQPISETAKSEAEFEDIDLPQGMTKKIIQQGQGEESPSDGSEVTVHYTGTFEDGKEFDSSISRGSPFNFTLGEGAVIKGWDIALKTMKRHEIAEFYLPPDLAYGERGSPPTIPPNTPLKFVIELKDWTTGESDNLPIHKLSIEEKLEKCKEVKVAGSSHFSGGKYDSAIEQYRQMVRFAQVGNFKYEGEGDQGQELDDCPVSESSDESGNKKELKQMLVIGYLNLALCYLKLNKTKDCIKNCDEALKIEPKNIKAFFRKGIAYMQTNDHELALKEFEKLLEVDPNNAEAKIRKNACTKALKSYYDKQRDLYKNMFPKW